jgi:PAS domain S-box-containing protein
LKEVKNQIEFKNPEVNAETGYLSIAKVEGTGWLAIVQRDYQSNLQPQQSTNQATTIIFFTLLFIVLSLGLLYIRKIVMFNNKEEITAGKTKEAPADRINDQNIPLIEWDHDLKILRFDRVFEEMTGWSKKEVLGKKVDVLLSKKPNKESLDRIGAKPMSEKTAVFDVPILHSDGKTAMAYGHYVPTRKQGEQEIGRPDGKMERRILERTGNLEAANRRLEAFSYSIFHALSTPLQSIEKLCDLAKEKKQGKADDKESNSLELISREAKHMGQLINDMKKLSDLNRREIKRQSIDATRIVGEIMETYKQKYPDREVEVTIEKDIIIDGDEVLLTIALENLIDNAWKFTVSKKSTTIKIGTILKDGTKALFINDNGVGFDMAHINKLFGAFQHIDKSTSTSVGNGIGLATVQRIVERHEGEIWAESIPGKGATFYFTLSP